MKFFHSLGDYTRHGLCLMINNLFKNTQEESGNE